MQRRIILILCVLLFSCKEENKGEIIASIQEVRFEKFIEWDSKDANQIFANFTFLNKTSQPEKFQYTDSTKFYIRNGLWKVELIPIDLKKKKGTLKSNDSLSLLFKIDENLIEDDLYSQYIELNDKIGSNSKIYILNLFNSTFESEIDFSKSKARFFLDNEKVNPSDSIKMKKRTNSLKKIEDNMSYLDSISD